MQTPFFPDADTTRQIAESFGTPVYVYDEAALTRAARDVLAFPNAFGLTARYAMKANPNAAVLRLFSSLGLHIDASSGHEVHRALRAGIPPEHISLSSQELPDEAAELLDLGVKINATSLLQIAKIGAARPGSHIGLRVNPGLGSGGTKRTNVGGPASSFGIWHEHLAEAAEAATRHDLVVERIHTHIGSGTDPAVWQKVAGMSLALTRAFPAVHTLNLGGGYKVARMPTEKGTDLQTVGAPVREAFERFAAETGRKLRLEIEPGTYLVALSGVLVATIQDVVDTGADGYTFLRLDTGMTEILRPSLYGAQHPLQVVPALAPAHAPRVRPQVVVGHCCESGDILTPAPGDPEGLLPRDLPAADPGDLLVIGGAGAYCAGMSAKNYNSFPEAPEVLLRDDGLPRLIRRRQSLEQIVANEVEP
jgi:diaminopimelate decarboxylase